MIKCPNCHTVISPDPPSDGFDYTSRHCSPLAKMTADWIGDWWKDHGDTKSDDPHLGLAVYVLERLFPMAEQGSERTEGADDDA